MKNNASRKYILYMKVLLIMLMICSMPVVASADSGRKIVNVSTVEEFINAVGDNTEIILQPGFYDFTPCKNMVVSNDGQSGPVPGLFSVLNGILNINGIDNLCIKGKEGTENTHIVTSNPDACVLKFASCKNIEIQGVTMGHIVEPGHCYAGVIGLLSVDNIKLKNLDLYGCGTYGVDGTKITKLRADNCRIHHCTRGAIAFAQSKDISFADSEFSSCHNKSWVLIDAGDSEIRFKKCAFINNSSNLWPLTDEKKPFVFEECRFGYVEQEFFDKYNHLLKK